MTPDPLYASETVVSSPPLDPSIPVDSLKLWRSGLLPPPPVEDWNNRPPPSARSVMAAATRSSEGATVDLDAHVSRIGAHRPDFALTGFKRADVTAATKILRARGLAVPLLHSFDDGATFVIGCYVGERLLFRLAAEQGREAVKPEKLEGKVRVRLAQASRILLRPSRKICSNELRPPVGARARCAPPFRRVDKPG